MKKFPTSKKRRWLLNHFRLIILLWSMLAVVSGDPLGMTTDYSLFASDYEDGYRETMRTTALEGNSRPFVIRSAGVSESQSSSELPTSIEKDEEEPVKRYPVFNVEFQRVETPFIIGLWIFCASIAKIGFHMTPKLNKIFPESCLLIVVGVVIGFLLYLSSNVNVSPLTPDTFFLYMLPPIILDAGYFMPNRLFFDHLGTILLMAVIGTIFNTLTIGASLYAVGISGLFGKETPLLEMFLFSALISAVDPVAVLAVFEEIHVNEILYIVVFGESLLNDAVTVVLYHMFEAYNEMGPARILYTDVLSGFASFFVVALGGTIIGIAWGFLTGLVTRYTDEVRVIEPIFIFVMAYLAYLNAEIFHMSGILAITFCGITMKNYVEANISHKSHTTVKYAMKMLSSSSETIIFMFLGVATVNDQHEWNTWFVIMTILFCSVFRVIGVIMLTAIANHFRLNKLTKVDKFVMSYGGLRGAVAFALVLLIDGKHVSCQPMFVTTTIAVIYFTVFLQGITIKPLVKFLNVKRAEKRKCTMNERIHERFMDHLMAGIEDIVGSHGNYHIRDKFKRFDNKFIRPFLLRNYQGAEPKILETYSKLAMKDAMEYMRRNASTIGNISGTESMSAIFKNYTAPSFNTSTSLSQLDTSTWNIDLQELEYNPSRKDLTDAKIHHLLSEELCKPRRKNDGVCEMRDSPYPLNPVEWPPPKVRRRRSNEFAPKTFDRDFSSGMTCAQCLFPLEGTYILPKGNSKNFSHRRLSYSRHAVNDRDLATQEVNYKMHMNIRRVIGERKHHKRSKKLNKDGKQNHVSFPEFQQNGSAKQLTNDFIEEVLQDDDIEADERKKEDWDGITFTAKSSPSGSFGLISQITNLPGFDPTRARLVKQYSKPLIDYDDAPSVAEVSLPWRRSDVTDNLPKDTSGDLNGKKYSIDSSQDEHGVLTPTATEAVLPWKRDDSDSALSGGPVKQSEFPAWCSNKEYIAYSSPSATFLGGIEQPKTASVIGLFRRESSGSVKGLRSRANSESSLPVIANKDNNAGVLLIEEGVGVNHPTDLLNGSGSSTASNSSRKPLIGRRGSMLELSSSVDPIPEEELLAGTLSYRTPHASLPSLMESYSGYRRPVSHLHTPYASIRRHYILGHHHNTSSESSQSSIGDGHI